MISDPYEVSWLTELLHSFPHIDLTFKAVNSTFNPEDARYREVLVFWAAVPVLWLLFLLLVFLMYFCYRCCQRDVEKKQRVPCLRWSMSILTFLTMAAIGVGFYGNERTRVGVQSFTQAAEDAERTVEAVHNQMKLLDISINGTANHGMHSLYGIFNNYESRVLNESMKFELEKMMNQSRDYTYAILQQTARVQQRTAQTHFQDYIDMSRQYDFYRWISTLVYLCWMLLLCLLLLIGIATSSKCTLLTFCAFGIFTLVICWMSAGVHTGVSVGMADFCVDPDAYIESHQRDGEEKDVVHYYMTCDVSTKNPFQHALQTATDSLRQANQTVSRALTLADNLNVDRSSLQMYVDEVQRGLDSASGILMSVTALVNCVTLHKDYTHAMDALCNTALPGVVLILLCCVLTGLLFTILVTLASRAWRHFSRRKDYETVEEDDPFLPRAEQSTYYSFTRSGRPPGGRDMGSIQRRPTPPPAYNSYDYRTEEMTPPPQHAHAHSSAPPHHHFDFSDSQA